MESAFCEGGSGVQGTDHHRCHGELRELRAVSSSELTGMAAKTARGSMFLFVGNTSATVILAVGAIIIARLLGPSNYGLLSLTLLIPTLLAAIADLGINQALVRFSAKLESEGDYYGANKAIGLGILFKISISGAAFLICYSLAETLAPIILNRPELTSYLRLASALIILQAVFDAANNSFIGLGHMEYSAGIQVLYAISRSVLAPTLFLIGFGFTGAIWGYLLGTFIAGATGAAILFAKHTPTAKGMSDSPSTQLSVMLRYGLPAYLGSLILGTFLIQYQSIVLAHFATNLEVGNFSAVWNFNSALLILVYPIATAMFPMFARMNPTSQRKELATSFALAVKYNALLMVPATVGLAVFAKDCVYLTFGSGYTLAPQYLILLCALYLLTAIGYLMISSFLNGVADTRTFFKIGLLTLAVYLPLGPSLAWLLGPSGLLVAYTLSLATSASYGIHKISVRFNARPDLNASARILLSAFAAAVPAAAFARLDPFGVGILNLIIGSLIFLAAYLSFAPIMRAVDKQDITNLRTILSGTPLVARIAKPLFDYESMLLSKMKRN